MIIGEELDIRAHVDQVREGIEVGWEKRDDREEGELRDLKEVVGKKAKRKLD